LGVIGYQLTVIGYQLAVIGYQLTVALYRKPSGSKQSDFAPNPIHKDNHYCGAGRSKVAISGL
jgi:hypothetical protein